MGEIKCWIKLRAKPKYEIFLFSTDSGQQNIRRQGLWHFSGILVCMCAFGYPKCFVKLFCYQQCRLISQLSLRSLLSHRLHWPRAAFWLLKTLFSWVSLPKCESVTVNSPTTSLRLNRPTFFFIPYFRSRISTKVHAAHYFVYFGIKTTQTKKDVPDNLTPSKNAEEKIFSLATHPRTQRETYSYMYIYIHECTLLWLIHTHTHIYIYIYILYNLKTHTLKNFKGSQRFGNISVMWGTIRKLRMHLPWSWRWRTTVSCEMPTFPHKSPSATRWIWHYDFEHGLGLHASKSIWSWLIVEVLATQKKFLEPFGYCTVINGIFTFCTTNVFGSFRSVMARFLQPTRNFLNRYGPVRTCKAQILELDYIARATVQLSNFILCEAMNNV